MSPFPLPGDASHMGDASASFESFHIFAARPRPRALLCAIEGACPPPTSPRTLRLPAPIHTRNPESPRARKMTTIGRADSSNVLNFAIGSPQHRSCNSEAQPLFWPPSALSHRRGGGHLPRASKYVVTPHRAVPQILQEDVAMVVLRKLGGKSKINNWILH